MSKKVAFAISVYNKLYELGILVDIIRNNFGSDAYINVVCNNTEYSKDTFREHDIDDVQIESSIQLQKDKHLAGQETIHIIQLRILEQFTKGIRKCADNSGADYTLHLHADAWPLSRDGVESVIHETETKNKLIGVRGYGFAYGPNMQCPDGHVQEMFFFAKNSAVLDINYLDYNYADLLFLRPNIHGMVTSLIKFRVGATNVHWYSDLRDTVGWVGMPKKLAPHTAMGPLNFDPVRKFIHLDANSFLDEDGYSFMSKYITEAGLSNGKHIKEHLKNYPYNPNLIEEHRMKLLNKFNNLINDESIILDEMPSRLVKSVESRGKWQFYGKNISRLLKRIIFKLYTFPFSMVGYNTLIERVQKKNDQTRKLHPFSVQYIKDYLFLEKVAQLINDGEMFDGVIRYDVSNDNLQD